MAKDKRWIVRPHMQDGHRTYQVYDTVTKQPEGGFGRKSAAQALARIKNEEEARLERAREGNSGDQ